MTAATTPNTASRGDWAWPLKPPAPMPSPSPPLELQFLPPSAAAAAATANPSPARPPPASPWTVDPSRLQKLMMGSVAAGTPSPASSIPNGSRAPVADFGGFFDPGINKPLPSGWERCLDLKSGEVFIKKSEVVPKTAGISPGLQRWQGSQPHQLKHPGVRPTKVSDKIVQIDEQSPDWTPNWVLGTPVLPTSGAIRKGMVPFITMDAKVYGEEGRPSSPDRPLLCLDLDLRLTSDSRSRLASETPDLVSSRGGLKPATSVPSSRDFSSHSRVQTWKWQSVAHDNERPASIQEMVSESTMATAVCSKCLMYVLLKKSNPTCPRCFNPIILDSGAQISSVKKRPRLELSPDDLSLSTDSSR